MNRSLTILFLVFLIWALFAPAWGETNAERCKKAYEAKDYTTAYPACLKAAEQGDADAQFLLGGVYDKGQGVKQDYAEAVKWYRKAAEQGNADAQYKLASCYERGDGVKQDYTEAVRLYRAAAKQGHTKAQHNLGVMYATGMGVEKDYKEAIKWYQMAAEAGDSSAQYALGYMYVNGYGVPKDQIQALMYWEMSSAQGNIAAMLNKGLLLKEMSQRQIAEAQKMARAWLTEAVKWYRKAAEQGNADAQYKLALCYERGDGVKQDYAEAVRLYRAAAKQGHTKAQHNLGVMYATGMGVEKDYKEAIKWYQMAAEAGDSSAQLALGMLTDIVTYVDLLQKLADNGHPDAQYELAERYISGDGIETNRHLAEKWLIRSILNDNKNQKSIDLIEKEFGWHCILTDDNRCFHLINKTSIKHDTNLSWYWSQSLGKIKGDRDNKYVIYISRRYDVMNCSNRTVGCKAFQMLDYDLHVVPNKNFTIKDSKIEFKPLEPGIYSDRLFNYVCGPTDVDKKAEDVQEVSFGTGWPIQPGYIVTNQHVVSGKKKIAAVSTSGEKISATVLIEDKINDLALLQVNHPEKLPPALPIAKSSAKTGSKVFTIGYPHPDIMGAKPKLTEGIVNALSGYMDDPRILQISVPVQSGNSGGPLLNMNGEVIGIVTAKLSAVKMFNWTGDFPQNVNYAVKATYITALLNSVKEMAPAIGNLSVELANLESLSSRIQNSILMVIAE